MKAAVGKQKEELTLPEGVRKVVRGKVLFAVYIGCWRMRLKAPHRGCGKDTTHRGDGSAQAARKP